MSSNTPGLIDAHVGRQLRARRRHLKLKQADLASALQVSVQQVHKYEAAKSSLPAMKLLALSRVLGVEPAYFFAGLEGTQADRVLVRPDKPALR
ncbi:MAG: helix-turn-helix domain-containing protein [Caulobacteraceae bacterium]